MATSRLNVNPKTLANDIKVSKLGQCLYSEGKMHVSLGKEKKPTK